MNESSSTDRPVSIAAWTIALIDWGSIGMLGRKRHSYSSSWPRRQLDDRLEGDLVDVLQGEEVVEHLRLDDLARLGHADPVGEAGQLDRRGQRDEVALAFGQRRVEVDEAVRRGVDCGAISRRERVGQLRRPAR